MRILKWLAAPVLALGFQACNSGTEVGNPEQVSARVGMMPAGPGWEMRTFHVKVMGVQYHGVSSDSGMLWAGPDGYMVDAAGADSGALPDQSTASTAWTSAIAELAFPKAAIVPGDSTAWSQVSDPGWAAFRYNYGGLDKKLLFAMPDTLRVKLAFDSATLNASRHGDSLALRIWFDCGNWVQAMDDWNLVMRPGLDGEFAVLSPSENAAMYAKLRDALPGNFKTGPGLYKAAAFHFLDGR